MNTTTDGRNDAYAALVAKVDAFHADVSRRRSGDLACRRGCDACCLVQLSVSAVEAAAIERQLEDVNETVRSRLLERWNAAQGREGGATADAPPRCIMLEDDGSCAVYAVRPLVCRTQGLALRYPPHTFPDEAVMGNGGDGSDIVWCPLSFKNDPPQAQDVLEAGRLDEMLVLVNLDYVAGDRQAAVQRISLDHLVGAWLKHQGRRISFLK